MDPPPPWVTQLSQGQPAQDDDLSPIPTDTPEDTCQTLSITFNVWKLKFPPGKATEVKGRLKGRHGKKGLSNVKITKTLQPKWVNFAPPYPVKNLMNLHCDYWVDF